MILNWLESARTCMSIVYPDCNATMCFYILFSAEHEWFIKEELGRRYLICWLMRDASSTCCEPRQRDSGGHECLIRPVNGLYLFYYTSRCVIGRAGHWLGLGFAVISLPVNISYLMPVALWPFDWHLVWANRSFLVLSTASNEIHIWMEVLPSTFVVYTEPIATWKDAADDWSFARISMGFSGFLHTAVFVHDGHSCYFWLLRDSLRYKHLTLVSTKLWFNTTSCVVTMFRW